MYHHAIKDADVVPEAAEGRTDTAPEATEDRANAAPEAAEGRAEESSRHRHAIKDADWERIKGLLPGRGGLRGRAGKDNRLFIDAVLWIGKTGAPWRDLPARFGHWNSVWKRFDRWSRSGVWTRIFQLLGDPDLEWLILDSMTARAHPHAAGAKKKPDGTGGQEEQALGRSRGGFGTKIHAAVSGLGLPVKLILTGAEAHDVTQGPKLIEGVPAEEVIADKGYDSDKFVGEIEEQGKKAVIPPRKNRVQPREYDKQRYKERNLVERFWLKIKQYRRVATRYEKTARNFLAFVKLASIMVLLQ